MTMRCRHRPWPESTQRLPGGPASGRTLGLRSASPMAAEVLQDVIGVGAALTKARTKRGLTLDEASRDTRIRVDHLRALEDEDFDQLPGEVYVRGSLRTYAQYLGLSPDKVLGLYGRHADDARARRPPRSPDGMGGEAMTASRFRDNQRLGSCSAPLTLLILAVVFGVLSRQRSAPAGRAPTSAQQPSSTGASPPTSSPSATAQRHRDDRRRRAARRPRSPRARRSRSRRRPRSRPDRRRGQRAPHGERRATRIPGHARDPVGRASTASTTERRRHRPAP